MKGGLLFKNFIINWRREKRKKKNIKEQYPLPLPSPTPDLLFHPPNKASKKPEKKKKKGREKKGKRREHEDLSADIDLPWALFPPLENVSKAPYIFFSMINAPYVPPSRGEKIIKGRGVP